MQLGCGGDQSTLPHHRHPSALTPYLMLSYYTELNYTFNKTFVLWEGSNFRVWRTRCLPGEERTITRLRLISPRSLAQIPEISDRAQLSRRQRLLLFVVAVCAWHNGKYRNWRLKTKDCWRKRSFERRRRQCFRRVPRRRRNGHKLTRGPWRTH